MFVMDSLKVHLEWAQKNGYNVLYCAPYGSWNYGVASKDSDVDSFMIVMPSLRELALGAAPNLTEHILSNNEHLIACDLRRFKNDLLKGDFRALEVATSTFLCKVCGDTLSFDNNPPFAAALNSRLFGAYCLSTIASLEKYNFKSFDRLEWEDSRDMKKAYNLCVRLFSAQHCLNKDTNPFDFERFEIKFLWYVKKGNHSPHKVYSLFSAVDFDEMHNECIVWMNNTHSKKPVMELNKWVYSEFEKKYELK